jgi:hypothetical protein
MEKELINVAPSSTEGHFVKNAEQVVNLDDVNETFEIKGSATLTTKNHTELEMEEDCMITCQHVYDHASKMTFKSKD